MKWFGRKSKAEEKPPEEIEAADHSNIRTLDPYDFRVAHKRLAFLFRLSVTSNIVMVLALLVMASSFSAVLPLKEVRIALLKSDDLENKLVRVEPISQDIKGFDLFLEQKAKRYVKLLVDIDPITQGERLQEAWKMTSIGYYNKFKAVRLDSGAIQEAIDSGLVRSALVESISLIQRREDEWNYSVDFTQVDTRSGEEVERRKLRAYLTMTTRPQEVAPEDVYENPLGIVVTNMSIKARE
jgi:type IV secretion system protein VirB8